MQKSQECLVELYGSNVFNDDVMRQRLPLGIYRALWQTISGGCELDPAVAEIVASVMKDWAVEKGATHYTHWFQPMTGHTAEKHDSFISPQEKGGAMLEFSGKELIKGEPDASSFPSGGLRATFEARGYTAWDCTSPAFIREDPEGIKALCIPTAFCSYNGEALDLRTPLLRSMQALSKECVKVLRLLGDTVTQKVTASVGVEQEYFLLDRDLYKKRKDLIFTGRTLVGAKAPKGQELDDQYFTTIRQRVSGFMADLNTELWKLGVPAKTQHNETAPAQHEVAIVYNDANISSDHNQLVMMLLKKVAARHNLACLMHEKPFYGVNGSGKHDNWSLITDGGINLLKPGKSPDEQERFMLFLMAIVSAVDEYAPLLRLACASASNDNRLGSHEAPPAILSIFLGEELTDELEAVVTGCGRQLTQRGSMKLGVSTIPSFQMDDTDRNRTSPFAFTGNKFELRMLGSSQAPSTANTTMNTIVSQALSNIAAMLEDGMSIREIICKLYREHSKVIFNGNNYTAQWLTEAAQRGLPNLPTTLDAIPYFSDESAVRLFEKHGVYSKAEIYSRVAINIDTYVNTIRIEVKTLLDMAQTQIMPALIRWQTELATSLTYANNLGYPSPAMAMRMEASLKGIADMDDCINELSCVIENAPLEKSLEAARYWQQRGLTAMAKLREVSDSREAALPKDLWPLPTYSDMLFYV